MNVRDTLISVYAPAGLICAFDGWDLIGRIGSVSPQAGQLANIESIAAVVIGGISLFGGRGSVAGTLSGGQRQGVAVARAAAFGSRVIILDEPTAAPGVKESRKVLELIRSVRLRGVPIILISHHMPHVFEFADRIHVHRLGHRLCVVRPDECSMNNAVSR